MYRLPGHRVEMWSGTHRKADQIFPGIGKLRTIPLMPRVRGSVVHHGQASSFPPEARAFFFMYSEGE